MSSMEQLEDNLKIFEGALPGAMTAGEKELMTQVRLAYESRVRVAAPAVILHALSCGRPDSQDLPQSG